jgi:hypothetical protein
VEWFKKAHSTPRSPILVDLFTPCTTLVKVEQTATAGLDLCSLLSLDLGFFDRKWKIGFDGIKLVNGPSQARRLLQDAILNVLRGTFSTLATEENYFAAFPEGIENSLCSTWNTRPNAKAWPCFHPP